MNEWANKFWGETREIIHTPYYAKHELKLIKGGYCSLHYHRQRANRFIVKSGKVEIITWFGPIYQSQIIGPDNTIVVASLVAHLFFVHADSEMDEEYYPDRGGEVTRDDIVRLMEGGNIEEGKSIIDTIRGKLSGFRI